MRFADPQMLFLLLLLPPWALLRRRRERTAPSLLLAAGARIEALPDTLRARCARALPLLRLLLLTLAIVALARPQLIEREVKVHSEGVDLVVALDLSTSMLAEDLAGGEPRKNRLTIAKEVLAGFLQGRRGDRIALLAFAARPYPAAPLTLDHDWLQSAVAQLQTGVIEDGTAIGDAMLAALNRLRSAASEGNAGQAQSQAIILLTDGRSNAGSSTPELAAAAARTLGVRVHTIGIGASGPAVIPVDDPLGGTSYRAVQADLDESTLREIASSTGGSYFRADDRDVLAKAFADIDRLEKRRIEEKVFFSYEEMFPALLLVALALGVAELGLRTTLLRTLP
jgi:Ca-activated chloride channel family protein